jgi:hypothetical protein
MKAILALSLAALLFLSPLAAAAQQPPYPARAR